MTMFSVHPMLTHVVAAARCRDAMAEAERARRADEARAGRATVTIVAAVRRRIGATMVRAGERLQGAGRTGAAESAVPSISTLRVAR